MVREARAADAGEIAGIYNFFVERTAVSFEEAEVAARMDGADGYPWLVWEEAGAAAGFACLRRWQQRAAYRRAAEVSVYVRRGRNRRRFTVKEAARTLAEAPPLNWTEKDAGEALDALLSSGKLRVSKNPLWKGRLTV